MNIHEKINYIEFPSKNIQKTKEFFTKVFNWNFEDFGEEYTAFNDGTINGGFFKSTMTSTMQQGSALVVFYSSNLEQTQEKIEKANGVIVNEIFSFPGGRRFHFADPNGNEYAVWSDLGL